MNKMKPTINLGNLDGEDGNAFAILGKCLRAVNEAGWSQEQKDDFFTKATEGGYVELMRVVKEHFEI